MCKPSSLLTLISLSSVLSLTLLTSLPVSATLYQFNLKDNDLGGELSIIYDGDILGIPDPSIPNFWSYNESIVDFKFNSPDFSFSLANFANDPYQASQIQLSDSPNNNVSGVNFFYIGWGENSYGEFSTILALVGDLFAPLNQTSLQTTTSGTLGELKDFNGNPTGYGTKVSFVHSPERVFNFKTGTPFEFSEYHPLMNSVPEPSFVLGLSLMALAGGYKVFKSHF